MVTDGLRLPPGIRPEVLIDRQSDGNPLFVEELTKSLLQSGQLREPRRGGLELAVPLTRIADAGWDLDHPLLMARLDRLPVGAGAGADRRRDRARVLACPDRRSGAANPRTELASALERLVAAGLLFRQSAPPHASYLFKHALVQDAAYGTLLREPRRVLHARIAETLESRFPEIAETPARAAGASLRRSRADRKGG